MMEVLSFFYYFSYRDYCFPDIDCLRDAMIVVCSEESDVIFELFI